MKFLFPRLATAFLTFLAFRTTAAVLYVSLNSTNPVPPYADWSTAATNIQDAVDAANAGDLVLASNGLYQAGGRMLDNSPPTNRVSVTKVITLSSVNGPTVTIIGGYQMPGTTNGAAAVRCVFLTNGAVSAGFTLTNGATYYYPPDGTWNLGGAVFCQSTNPVGSLISDAIVSNCVLIGNSAGFGHVAYGGRLNNCVLAFNAGGASYCSLNNCTVVSNSTSIGGGVHFSAATNCIIYYNLASTGANSWGSTLAYCCTPDPGGVGNITNEPAFVNLAGGDFHLQSNSPCINSGGNSYVVSTTDLDGNPRIVGGTVDIGAYEYQTPTSIISYAWLQQYGFPTDGSADYADLDGTGFNVYQDWIAGLNPTNPASVLIMLTPVSTNNPPGLVVSWESVNTRTYFLQSSTNLAAQPAFSTIQSNLIGQEGTTSYTDTMATNGGSYYYRVGVQ